jgi:multimeric flavodoxin WrbA
MKILAINGSPKGDKGCTAKMLQPFLQGMQDAGAETELVNLSKLNIKHCSGCMNCWFKTPGKCIYNDDMAALLKKLLAADLIVYGTPLYGYSMTGTMKDFMDRGVPLYAKGNSVKNKKMLLVSPCGFPELANFDALVFTFKKMATMSELEYLGALLRPAAHLMGDEDVRWKEKTKEYYSDLRMVGQQIIRQGKAADELLAKICQPWISPEEYHEMLKKVLAQ